MNIIEGVRVIHFWPAAVSGPMDVVFQDAAEGGKILETGNNLAARHPGARKIGGGAWLSPGLVCGHTHLYSALARGLMVDIQPAKDFGQQLQHLWWRLDRAIDRPILESSALAGCADAALCGVTSLVDHHASPSFIDGSLTVIEEAFHTLGLRGLLCYEVTDRNGEDGARAGIAENLRFARSVDARRAAGREPRVEAAIGAHASFTLGKATLDALARAVGDTGRGLHVHAGEDKYDASDSRLRFGADLAVRFDRAGCLGPKAIIGHGVWLSPEEIELLNQRDAFLAHNARSNMNNNVGYAGLLPQVKNTVLGTDGMDADMLGEFRFAFFKNRDAGGPLWPDFYLAALDRGNRLLERHFGGRFGRVEAGYPADLVLWDYDPPTPLEDGNLGGHCAFGLASRHVHSVIAGGRTIVADHRPCFDAEAINARAREQARRLWQRM